MSIMNVWLQEQSNNNKQLETRRLGMEKKWWKESVVYQIYPRSFKNLGRKEFDGKIILNPYEAFVLYYKH